MNHSNIGSTLDSYLKEESNFEAFEVQAIKEVVAWQLTRAQSFSEGSRVRGTPNLPLLHDGALQGRHQVDTQRGDTV